MDDDRRISCNTSLSFSPAMATEAVAPQGKRKPGAAKAGLRVKRMDLVEEDINDSAEQFIKRFRENLLLQRLQSIENYRQMLARGV
ncbi:uncharacterized protein LOC110019104 [Phalaenopsis equestris]|uniref:uncharacterized protein LOC110019104 n=1 Tax=Phalaenopsis equestris TaxID=78828 RepID=UPI0009E4A811|nr:uncharacterized protein LOC110019104 [Phalaenopsis equestris]